MLIKISKNEKHKKSHSLTYLSDEKIFCQFPIVVFYNSSPLFPKSSGFFHLVLISVYPKK